MKRIQCILLLLACSIALSGCGASEPETAQLFAMDTVMNLTAYGSGAKAALDASSKEIDRLEDLLSRTKSDSAVSQLNQNAGTPMRTDPELVSLLQAAIGYSDATSGAFDVTVAPIVSAWGFTTDHYQVPAQETLDQLLPLVGCDRIQIAQTGDSSAADVTLGSGQSVDLGGIAKGYTSDRVASIFADHQITSGMISLGGNVYVRGTKPDGSTWRVAVQDPNNTEGYVGVLSLKDAFAVTSGGYQRYFEQGGKTYHHIIDPSTGYPAESGLTSVTVVASANQDEGTTAGSGTMCDAFSTALFVMGEERALDFWRSSDYSFNLILVTADGRVLVTGGIADQFEDAEGSEYTYEIVH